MIIATVLLFLMKPINIFGVVYSATLILGFLFILISGIRQKYPVSSWVTISTSVLVLFMIGIKLFAYSLNEWEQIILGSYQHITHVKYIPGGFLLVAFGIPLIKCLLKFRTSVFDGFVIFLPILEILQRFGCFLNGCCYGIPTNLPWAVHYTWPSALFYKHFDQGLLEADQMHSLGVHPTQLYSILLSLGILALLIWTRDKFRASGSQTLFALLLLGGRRFFLEFLREPTPGTWSSVDWHFMNVLQWGILLLSVVFVYLLWKKEHRHHQVVPTIVAQQDQVIVSYGVILTLIFIVWQIREIFERIELIILYPILLSTLAVISVSFFRENTTPVSRMIMISLLITAFFSMGQTLETVQSDSISDKPRGWFSAGGSGSFGAFEIVTEDCSGNVISRTKRNYSLWGVNASYHYLYRPDRHLETGLRQYYINYPKVNQYDEMQSLYLSPFISYDAKRFGVSLGLISVQEKTLNYDDSYILPSFYFRAGRRDSFFADLDIYNRTHYMGSSSLFQLGLGFGLKKGNFNNIIRGGLTVDEIGDAGVYLGSEFLIKNHVTISPYFTTTGYPSASLNLKWHIGKDKWKAAK